MEKQAAGAGGLDAKALLGEVARDSEKLIRLQFDLLRSDLHALRSVSLGAPPASAAPAPRRPAVIGKYLVVGSLGSGGQAEVFLAVHPTLDKELVVKLGSFSNTAVIDSLAPTGMLVALRTATPLTMLAVPSSVPGDTAPT